MKRIFAVLLVAVMLFVMCTLGVSAEQGNNSYGDVPKVTTPLTIDGEMEADYENGLRISCTRVGGGKGTEIDGYAYVLYDECNLYLYVIVNDDDYGVDFEDSFHFCYEHGCQLTYQNKSNKTQPTCDHVTPDNADPHSIWDDDCVEVFIDWENNGENAPDQYRISRHGEMSRDWSVVDTGFHGIGKDYGTYWCAEYAIPLDDNATEGTALGFDIMLHSEEADFAGEYWCFANNGWGWGMGQIFQPWYYDYIVLGGELAHVVYPPLPVPNPEPIPSPTNDPTDSEPTTPSHSDDPDEPIIYAPIDPVEKESPKTADPIVMIVLAAAMSLGAAIVVKKTCFNK